MSAVEDIRIKIAARLRAVEEEIESLRTALGALEAQADAAADATAADGGAETAGHPPARTTRARSRTPRTHGGRRRGGEPSAAEKADTAARAAEIEKLLAAAGGPEAVSLARQSGIDPAEVLARINELERAGRARS